MDICADSGSGIRQYGFFKKNERGDLILEKLVIHGGNRLSGEIEISGAKNAAVAIIPAVPALLFPMNIWSTIL